MKEVLNMLNNLIEAMMKSPEIKNAWEDFTDAITVETMKNSYLNTLNGGLSSHPEDIASNKEVNAALVVCLKYFMYVKDAEAFLKEAQSECESD
jgi:hypothetical protein